MKKLLFIIAMLLSAVAYSQYPVLQAPYGDSVLFVAKGAAKSRIITNSFRDTTAANLEQIRKYPGAIIKTQIPDAIWYRNNSATMWVMFTFSFFNQNCGNTNGTHLVTWDSVLDFDVTAGPYVLCCDRVPRISTAGLVRLDTNSTSFQRIDAIILDSNGINKVKGTPALNPTTPNTNDCQIVLAYVLINANDSVPAFITPTNPGYIYDENQYGSFFEWPIDSTFGVTADTANTQFPVHGTKDIFVSSYTTGGYMIFTAPQSIHLNDYAVLKLYVRKTVNTVLRLDFVFYLDGQQKTSQTFQSIPASGAGFYTVINIPISSFNFLSTDEVNKLRVIITGAGNPIYIDWIQLQGSFNGQPANPGVASISETGNIVNNVIVNSPNGPNVVITNPLRTQLDGTFFGNQSGITAVPTFSPINLSHSANFTNTLAVAFLTPGSAGQFITNNGTTTQWAYPQIDTTFVGNGLVRRVIPTTSNDSLLFGYSKPDTAGFLFDTYLNQNNFFLAMQKGRFELYKGTATAAANDLTLPNDGNAIPISGATQINAITTARWQAGSNVQLIFSGAPLIKNNTAGGAGTATILLAGGVDYQAAANDVLGLVYDGTNWHETSRKTAGTVTSMVGRNGITDSVDRYILGGTLYKNTTINSAGFTITITGSNTSTNVLNVTNTAASGTSRAIVGTATVSDGVRGVSTSGNGVSALSTNGAGLSTVSLNSTGAILQSNSASGAAFVASGGIASQLSTFNTATLNDAIPIFNLLRSTGASTPANGVGGSLDLYTQTPGPNSRLSNQLIWKWTDATDATRTSQLDITGVNSAVTNTIMSAHGSGVVGIGISSSYAASRLHIVNNAAGGGDMVVMTSLATGNYVLQVANGSTGQGLYASTTSGDAIQSQTTNGGKAFSGSVFPASTNTVVTNSQLVRLSSGTAADGIGESLDFRIQTSDGTSQVANQIISKWTTATIGTRVSQLSITGVDNAVTQELVTIDGSGKSTFYGPSIPNYTVRAITTTQIGVRGESTSGIGIDGTATTGTGVFGEATGSGIGVQGNATSGTGGVFLAITGKASTHTIVPASTNTSVEVAAFSRASSGTAANGIGGKIGMYVQNVTGGTNLAGELSTVWTDATLASRTSSITLRAVLNTATSDVQTWNADGSWQIRPITATAASAITPVEGMFVFVSNTNGTFTSIGPWCYYNGAWHAL